MHHVDTYCHMCNLLLVCSSGSSRKEAGSAPQLEQLGSWPRLASSAAPGLTLTLHECRP
jgi:hypothetical protein